MTESTTSPLPKASVGLVAEQAASIAASADLLLVRARPEWDGPATIMVGTSGRVAHVVAAPSTLAVLEACTTRSAGELLVVLTDREDHELGSAVMRNAYRQRIQPLNEWSVVPSLFGLPAGSPPAPIRNLGEWLPQLLLRYRPIEGWPKPLSGSLLPRHVVEAVLVEVLGIPRGQVLDAPAALEHLGTDAGHRRWRDLHASEQSGLASAAALYLDPQVGLQLDLASRSTVSLMGIGLALDAIYPGSRRPTPEGATEARVRLEPVVGDVSASAARSFADACLASLQRRLASGQDLQRELAEAETLLSRDARWPAGVAASDVLPGGLRSRLQRLAEAVGSASTQAALVEERLRSARAHALWGEEAFAPETRVAEAAVRLWRWASTEPTPATTLAAALLTYGREGGWADRAYATVWNGSDVAENAAQYGALLERVDRLRSAQDTAAAELLSGDAPVGNPEVVPIEKLLEQLVVPLAEGGGVLLIVLDGMSAAVASEITQDALGRGWAELLREGAQARPVALAALPSATTYSRTTLFAGELLVGTQAVEKPRFASNVQGLLFHKDDLRSDGGQSLPSSVRDPIASRRKIVGAVLNHVDDTLAKLDPARGPWTVPAILWLRELLEAARDAGRTVILTSDHGHVVERGGTLRSHSGGGARWRPADTAVSDDEVLVSGPRVLTADHRAILAVNEKLRYAPKQAGYHGGAALAELTIPIIVLHPTSASARPGWVQAPPQTPLWWNESPARAAVHASDDGPKRRRSKKQPTPPAEEQGLFEIEPAPVVELSVPEKVLASETYASQRARAGRMALPDDEVLRALTHLISRDGRANRESLASIMAVPAASMGNTLAVLKRMLNIEGYEVIDLDADGVTVVLNEALLVDQFELDVRKS